MATIAKGFYFNRTDLFENIVKIQESLGIPEVPTETSLGGYGNTGSTSTDQSSTDGSTIPPVNPGDTTSMLARLLSLDNSIADIYLRYTDKTYTDTKLLDKLSKLGDTVLGNLSLMVTPVSDNHLVHKKFVEDLINIVNSNLTTLETIVTTIQSTYTTKVYVDASEALKVNKGGDSMSGALSLALDPINDSEAATKRYVDQVTTGIKTKPSVRVASIINIDCVYTPNNLSITGINPGQLVIDGLILSLDDKVLLINQNDKKQNGCYTVIDPGSVTTNFILHRSDLVSLSSDIPGSYFFVTSGVDLTATGWLLLVNDPSTFIIDTDIINVTQFSGRGILIAGNGLTLNGNTFNINTADSSRIVVNADTIDLALTGVNVGEYTKVVIDTYGRITNGNILTPNDIPALDWSKIGSGKPTTLTGYGVTDAVNISGSSMSGFLTLNADPVNTLHAATKVYVDDSINNTKVYSDNKDSVIQTQVDSLKIVTDILNTDSVTKTYVDTQDTLKVNKAGDTLTGYLTLNGDPQVALHASTKQYTDSTVAALKTQVDIVDSNIQTELTAVHTTVNALNTDPVTKSYVDNKEIVIKTYTDAKDSNLQSQLSSLQTSLTTLNTDPVTKTYVDNTKVSKTGDTLTGALILKGSPSLLLEAANKEYVDTTSASLKTYVDTQDSSIQTQLVNINSSISVLNTDSVTKTYVDTQDTLKVNKAGDTITGPLYLSHIATLPEEAVTKSYVDALNASMITRPSVRLSSTFNLATLYDNGISGIGSKLTSTSNGNLILDGVSTVIGDTVLIKDQIAKKENGVYKVIDTGSLSAPFILERDNNFNQTQEISGSYFFVTEGATFKGTGWLALVNSPSTFTIGIDDINITQQSGNGTITPGLGIDVVGNTISTKLGLNSGLVYTNGSIDTLVDIGSIVKGVNGLSIAPTVIGDIADRVSKTVDTTVSANVTFAATKKLKVTDTPVAGTDVTNKTYVDAADTVIQGQVTTLQGTVATLNTDPATKTYIDAQDALKLNITGGTMTGAIVLNSDPVANLHPSTKQYTDNKIAILSDSVNAQNTGLQTQINTIQNTVVSLNTDPVNKSYVDSADNLVSTNLLANLTLKVDKAGDTLTGPLTLSGNPVTNLQAAPKQYVDTSFSNIATNTSILLNAKLDKIGGTLTGALILNADPTVTLGAATKQYVDGKLVSINASSLTGILPISTIPGFVGDAANTAGSNTLTLANTGVIASTYNKVTVDSKGRVISGSNLLPDDIPNFDWSKISTGLPTTLNGYGINDALSLAGGQMSGYIGLHANPILDMHPATKQYVDTLSFTKFNITGGTLTGDLILNSDPVVNLQASTKQYVDSKISVTIPVGTVIVSTNENVIDGYLKCNGALVGTSQYPDLYNILYDKFNVGNYGAGKPWCYQYNTNNLNNLPKIEWKTTTSFPYSVKGHSLALLGSSFCLITGGMTSLTAYTASTYVSSLGFGSTLNSWVVSPTLPVAIAYHKTVVYNNVIYVIGGNNASIYSNAVYAATFDLSTNSISNWSLISTLPYGISSHESLIINNRIYILGGNTSLTTITNGIISADIKEDGTLGTWVNSGTLPLLYKDYSVSVCNSRIYLIGGNTSANAITSVNNVYSTDFSFNEWRLEESLPITMCKARCVTTNNVIMLLGGYTTTSVRTTYYAYIDNSGNLTKFINSNAALPTNSFDYEVAVIGSNMHIVGGMRSNTQLTNIVTYTDLHSTASSYSNISDSVFNIPGNGKPWCYQYNLNEDDNISLAWSTSSVLSNNLFNSKVLVTNSKIYLIGGTSVLNTGNSSSVTQYIINEDGTIGTKSIATPLPIALSKTSIALIKNKAYVLGGLSNTTIVPNVYYSLVNTDGTLGAWITSNPLPLSLYKHHTFTINNNIYLLGGTTLTGDNENIYISKIDNLGLLGSWLKIGTTPRGLSCFRIVVTNTRVYLLGGKINGNITNSVYYSYINKDGSIGGWNTYVNLPIPISDFNVIYNDNSIYIIGGYALNMSSSLVMKANIHKDDSLSTWSIDSNLPMATMYSNTVSVRDNIYVIGGYDGASINSSIYVSNFKGGRNNYISDIYPINEINYHTPHKHKHQHSFNDSIINNITAFTTDTTIPVDLKYHSLQVTSNVVYTLGGFTTTPVSSIYYSNISSLGVASAFTLSNVTLPVALYKTETCVLGNKLYIFGGLNSTNTSLPTVSYNAINTDGTLGAWVTSTALPVSIDDHQVIVTSSRVYVLGGETNTLVSSSVFSTHINSNNTIGAWTLSSPLPVALKSFKAILIKDYVYIIGGINSSGSQVNTVYSAKVYHDGTIGTFNLYGYIPIPLSNFDLISIQSKLFLIGGYTSLNTKVDTTYIIPITPDGSVGTFVDTSNNIQGMYLNVITLPTPMSDLSCFLTNSRLYITGSGLTTYVASFLGGANDYLNNPFNKTPTKFRLPDLSNTVFDVPNYNLYIKY